MEKGSIVGFLEGKSILVTGATGFLGKLLVEKVLRVQPDVKRVYLLLRAPDADSAAKRLHSEVLGKDVFRVLKEKHGEKFESFIAEKVIAVAGDVAEEGLGIRSSHLRETLHHHIHVVVHSAATTRFDERYDIALRTNTVGAKHVLDFAKKCSKLQMLVHVSTAYVAGEKAGRIYEKPFCMGETLNGLSVLDIEEECMLMAETLRELRAANSTKVDERAAMRKLGLQRARAFGWPNTYVFTKAMGEMLVGHFKENLPIAIVRPAMVSSTLKDPFPGWIEGCRTFDSLILTYARGHLSSFLANPKATMDVVPGDLVVNALILIMVYQLDQRYEFIYQVGSSSRNPMTYGMFKDYNVQYFLANPLTRKDGSPIQTHRLPLYSKTQFNLRVKLPYYLFCKALCSANITSCYLFRSRYADFNRKYRFLTRMADLYEPFVFFKGTFDIQNTERMREAMVEGCNNVNRKMLDFDIANIDWKDYFINIHIPGLLKYEFHE